MDPLRIAYLVPDPGIPLGGTKGASVHVAELCRALAGRGAEVTVLAQRVAAAPTAAPPDGVRIVALDPGPLPRGAGGDAARAAAAADFTRRALPVLRRMRPDVVIERLSLHFGAGAALARGVGAARLLEVNAPVVAESHRHRGLLDLGPAGRAEARAVAGSRVAAVSQPLADWAMARGAAQATVIPNGADPVRFAPARSPLARRRLAAGLGLEGAEVVGFVGSLKPWHGVEVLLAAAALLAPARPRLRVLVVGDGPQRASLELLAARPPLQGRVVFSGVVGPRDVPAYLAVQDVATAPYLPAPDFYFSPLKVVEAMAAGRPVVASDHPPVAAMLGPAGVLVRPGDPAALAAAVAGLLDDPARAARLGRAARRRSVAAEGWDGVATRMLAAALAPEPVADAGARRSA